MEELDKREYNDPSNPLGLKLNRAERKKRWKFFTKELAKFDKKVPEPILDTDSDEVREEKGIKIQNWFEQRTMLENKIASYGSFKKYNRRSGKFEEA